MPNKKDTERDFAKEAVELGAQTVDDVIPAYDARWHDEQAKHQKPDAKIGGYTESELRAMLARSGVLPEGISFSPTSRVPFVAFGEEEAERQAQSQRQFDASGAGTVVAAAPTATAGVAAPTGGADAGTGAANRTVTSPASGQTA